MKLDVLGLFGACSYALDCVEAELAHVTDNHAKRVAYMSVCMAQQMGITGEALQDLVICALLHDNALTQYIQEELHGEIAETAEIAATAGTSKSTLSTLKVKGVGVHCLFGEANVQKLPFHTDVKNVILYHHENADGSGPFGKRWDEVPIFARIIHLCDLLDRACRTQDGDPNQAWAKAEEFIEKVRGSIVDEACIDAFVHSFSSEEFLSLDASDASDLEKRLWDKVPRIKQELDFSQIQAVAEFFARIVDYKSPFTSTHSIGVAQDAEKLARYMGFDEETAQKMYLAGALHDIGKVAIGNEILEKPDRLTDDEFAVMKHHAAYTYYILSGIDGFDETRDWAAFHHERLDGSGYPFGKTAAELNTQERIMACVDIYQALTESRPYKKGMPHEKACQILKNMADKGWLDAEIVAKVAGCFGA